MIVVNPVWFEVFRSKGRESLPRLRSTYLKVRILCQYLIHDGFGIDLSVSDRPLTVISPPPINRSEFNLSPIVWVSGIDQNA